MTSFFFAVDVMSAGQKGRRFSFSPEKPQTRLIAGQRSQAVVLLRGEADVEKNNPAARWCAGIAE